MTVTVYRDEWFVPHIYADDEADGFRALGHVQAETHLERMLFAYRAVRGELAAVFGNRFVRSDVSCRAWLHLEKASEALERLSPQLRTNTEAFADGVLRYMAAHPAEVPEWAPPVDAAHVLAVHRLAFFGDFPTALVAFSKLERANQAVPGTSDWTILPDDDPAFPLLGALKQPQRASGHWALAPDRTADGVVALLCDPHGGFDYTGSLMEVALHAGDYEMYGQVTVGAALIETGHSRHLGWGWVTAEPPTDCADVYAFEREADGRSFRFDADRRAIRRDEVVIEVEGGPPLNKAFEYTRHNDITCPVVRTEGQRSFAVCDSHFEHLAAWQELLYRSALAEDIEGYVAALGDHGLLPKHALAAGSSGIFWLNGGRVPRRRHGADYSLPVDGNTSATAWQGFHPVDALPQVSDPPQGWIQSCNGAADAVTTPPPFQRNDFADPGALFGAPDDARRAGPRGVRTSELLADQRAAGLDDLLEIALDDHWASTSTWQAALRHGLAGRADLEDDAQQLLDRLLEFDGRASPDSRGALAYWYWHQALGSVLGVEEHMALCVDVHAAFDERATLRLIDDQDGPLLEYVLRTDESVAPFRADALEPLSAALRLAAERIEARFGAHDATLGDQFRLVHGSRSWPARGVHLDVHRFYDAAPRHLGASRDPIASWPAPVQEINEGGWGLRLMLFGDEVRCFTLVLNPNEEEDPRYRFDEQFAMASARELREVLFDRERVAANAASRQELAFHAAEASKPPA